MFPAALVLGLALPGGAPAAALQQYRIPTPTGGDAGAEAIVSGPDGGLWFTESAVDRIGRLTTAGGFTSYPVTPGSDPVGIAPGPDGALWFTEAVASRIGRMTTTGAITEYPLAPGARPLSIAAGPDGAMWFTESATGRIGRITADGTIAEDAPPTPASGALGIVTGPDGGVWFTEFAAGRIGRIDPATRGVTEFPAYPAGAVGTATQPAGIAAGPDGALWFTEEAGNKIARMTTTGALTQFDAAPGPFGITAGRDGALWFTQSGMGLPGGPSAPGLIGRLTTSGVADLFPLHPYTGQSPNDITVGPDGAIWITNGPAVARLTGDVSSTHPVVSGLAMSRRSFRVPLGPRRPRAAIRFSLSAPAGWSLVILRRQPGRLRGPGDCRPARTRPSPATSCVALTNVAFVHRDAAPAGRQTFAFTGYGDNNRRLPPGRYQAGVLAYSTRIGARPRLSRPIRFTILP